MCFNQTGDISTLNSSSLKLVDKFTCLGSCVSSTETDINTRLAKAWTSLYGSQTWAIKWNAFFTQIAVVSILLYGCTTWTLTKQMEKCLVATTQECCEQYWTSLAGSSPQSSRCTATCHPSRKISKLDKPDAGQYWRSKDELISDVLLWTPSHGWTKAGWPAKTYIQQLSVHLGYCLEDTPGAMNDIEGCR